jgi:lipopolysaccharide transport system ATP-binding protein
MSEVTVSLKNVSKCFKRYDRPVDRLKELLLPGKSRAKEFWALRDINLDIGKGETIGIIGQNGAGKSTLLQIIAGTLLPTTGTVEVNGRISALLELGSGFNPEFTGRQNVFFNGRLLGLSQKEIAERFDDIAAFADIGDFIDQSVKTYSSGMFIRLAFAVAVSSDPDILIVDEALAVGDVYFQQKCFERIRKLQSLGTTLLFVSHDPGSVYNLCDTAILVESGSLALKSTPRQVLDLYEANLLKRIDHRPDTLSIQNSPDDSMEPSSEDIAVVSPEVEIQFVELLDEDNRKVDSIISGQLIQISVGVLFLQAFDDPIIGFKIRDKTGATLFVNHTYNMRQPIGQVSKNTPVQVRFRLKVPLVEGEYTITIGVADSGFGEGQFKHALAYVHNTAVLKVLKDKEAGRWGGIVNLNPTVTIYRQAHV